MGRARECGKRKRVWEEKESTAIVDYVHDIIQVELRGSSQSEALGIRNLHASHDHVHHQLHLRPCSNLAEKEVLCIGVRVCACVCVCARVKRGPEGVRWAKGRGRENARESERARERTWSDKELGLDSTDAHVCACGWGEKG